MTREEIIRNLKYTMEKHKNDTVNTFGTNISVMCKDILDYLEQESCEDCVSREAVLSLPRLITDLDISTKTLTESVDIKMIESLPPVTPKPKAEKEIVRPYLEKLNEHIINFPWGDTNGDFMTGVNAVYNLIYDLMTDEGQQE